MAQWGNPHTRRIVGLDVTFICLLEAEAWMPPHPEARVELVLITECQMTERAAFIDRNKPGSTPPLLTEAQALLDAAFINQPYSKVLTWRNCEHEGEGCTDGKEY